MGINLSQIAAQRKTTEVDFDGVQLSVVHNPSALTPEFEAFINKAQEEGEPDTSYLCQLLCKLLISWDLVDDTGTILGPERVGEIVPIEPDTLKKVPYIVRGAIASAVVSEHSVVKKSDAPTRSGSFS